MNGNRENKTLSVKLVSTKETGTVEKGVPQNQPGQQDRVPKSLWFHVSLVDPRTILRLHSNSVT